MPTLAHTCTIAHTCTYLHTLAQTCTCNLISGPRPSRDTLIWARTQDSLTRVETESRHALGFRDLLIYGSGLACSPSDFLPRVVLPFNIGFGHSDTLLATKGAHSRRDLHRCSIQISTAVNKPSLTYNTKTCVHCNALQCIAQRSQCQRTKTKRFRFVRSPFKILERAREKRDFRSLSALTKRGPAAIKFPHLADLCNLQASGGGGGEVKTNKQGGARQTLGGEWENDRRDNICSEC